MPMLAKKLLKISLFLGLFFAAIFLFVPTSQAAVMSISPTSRNIAMDETFLAEVQLNSENKVINAVRATIVYPSDILEVVGVSQGESFLTLWAQEPTIDSSAGVISLAGGMPNGSLVINGKVLTITFRAKAAGGAEIGFDKINSSVHLNDGLGTSAPLTLISAIYNVSSNAYIRITSPTHPDENVWYKNTTFSVNWGIKDKAAYSFKLTDNPNDEPDNIKVETNGTITFTDLTEGIYYFILKETTNAENWRIVGKRRVMIDTRPPLPIDTSITHDKSLYDDQLILVFSAVDKGSGIDHYEIIEGDEAFLKAKSPYLLKDQSQKATLIVRAYDRAGNLIEKVLQGEKKKAIAASLNSALLTILGILAVGLVILILLLAVYRLRSGQSENKK